MKMLPLLAILSMASCKPVACDIEAPTSNAQRPTSSVYRGETLGGRPEGYGQLSVGDSIVYEGEWHEGRRHGRGICRDPEGHRVEGLWQNDTLLTIVRRDAGGIYRGEVDSLFRPAGYGSYEQTDSRYYEGNWADGQHHGLGFAMATDGTLRLGEWLAGRYKGERLEYNAERIYGIDISRFQHDIGKHTYAIDWNRMRITHLGTISKKRVAGQVDYPVRFVFIKSTEGTTIKNRYYAADYAAARSHGIPVGTYHFFSTKSAASAQAAYFLANSRLQSGDLPPVLDVEPSAAQIQAMGGTDALMVAIRTWMAIVTRRVGMRPVLYVSQNFVNNYLKDAPDIKRDYDVWIARYGEYKPDVHLAFWQLCPDGRVAGIHGDVDINVFNGYAPRFEEYLEKKRIK